MNLSWSRIWFIMSLLLSSATMNIYAEKTIIIPPFEGDATKRIQLIIDSLDKKFNDYPVTLQFSKGAIYNISRKESLTVPYFISNTTSIEENPDPTKHIGIYCTNLRNVTLDGNGAKLVTHGEMTSFVMDSCENITFKNFSLTAADPSVPEIKILEKDSNSFVFEVIPPSEFVVTDNKFYFRGEDWVFGDGGFLTNLPQYAQVFYPEKNVTLRCPYPLKNYKEVERIGERKIKMKFDKVPDVNPGEIYQLRHGIRNEATGFINRSKNVCLENLDFNFLGNFGIVGQFSENLTYDNIRCQPAPESERTNAGFADFVQMSSCKGKIIIKNSKFEGSHDDPINIHGTYLRLIDKDSVENLTIRYSHPQTYGFNPFAAGDEIEIIDRHTLNPLDNISRHIEGIKKIDEYNYKIQLDKELPDLPDGYNYEDLAIENITWTPEVEICNNYFARTPTRGVLLTTRRKSLIENNIFYRIPMAAILISDDASKWWESGPVKDLTIRRNTFIECSNPVISISPEIEKFDQPVHKNILIEGNRFIGVSDNFFKISGTDNVTIRNNVFEKGK